MNNHTEEFKTVLSQNARFVLSQGFSLILLSLIFIIPVYAVDFHFWGNDRLLQVLIDRLTYRGLIALGYFINVVLFLIFVFSMLAVIKFIDVRASARPTTLRASLLFAYQNLWSFLFTVFKKTFIVLAWSLALIVPGIYKAIVLSFVYFIKIAEPTKDPFKESEGIIKGRVGKFFIMSGWLTAVFVALFWPSVMFLDTVNVVAIETFFPTLSIVIGYFIYILIFWGFLFTVSFYYFLYRAWRT